MKFALAAALLILLILGSGCAGRWAEKAVPGAAEGPQMVDTAVGRQEEPQAEELEAEVGAALEEQNETLKEEASEQEDTKTEELQAGTNASLEMQEETPPAPQPINRLTKWAKEEGIRTDGISSSTIIKDGAYLMYYTGDGIALAKSSDGLNFVHLGQVVGARDVEGVDMVTNPAVFETKDGGYRMIFEGSTYAYDKNNRRLYSAVSSDGLKWAVEPSVRFQDAGDGKPGELFTSVPEIIRLDDGRLRMYYTRGATSATALSEDDGLNWTKEKNLELRKVAIDLDIVRLDDGSYRLFFTTFADEFGIGEQWVTSADSKDGIDFELKNDRLVGPSTPDGLVTDPDIVRTDDGYRMYYGEFKKGEENRPNIMSAFSSD